VATASSLTISGTPPSTVKAGSLYSFTPTTKDSLTGRKLAFNILYKPSWATFNGATGQLSGTPSAASVGTYSNIEIVVNDGINGAGLSSFRITVQAATVGSTPPSTTGKSTLTISGTPAKTVNAGSTYSFTPTTTDSSGRKLTFFITSKPSWATFNSATGQLSGKPSTVGKYSNILIAVSDGLKGTSLPSFTVSVVNGTNPPPPTVKISGTPATSVAAGQSYSFKPTATDSAGRTLSYSVTNKPAWATFSIASGLLAGTPTTSQTGTYSNITISASDGQSSGALPAFAITVASVAPKTGSATLLWTDPTKNTNGSTLTNLVGVHLYYGTSASALNNVITVADTSQDTYTISGLSAGTWYFAAAAYTSTGVQSALSQVSSKLIQ
jgi:hypothetical protein